MAFLGTARFLRRNHGEEMLTRVVKGAGDAARATFETRIDGLGLYPYEAFVGVLRSADRQLGAGDLAYASKLGEVAARSDLETIFHVYKVRPDPEMMIRGCTPIWGMYYDDAGYMEAVDTSPDRTILRVNEFPEMDPAHCRLMEGWMIAAMDAIGVRVLPGGHETECMSTGGRYHEFSCRWRPRADSDA